MATAGITEYEVETNWTTEKNVDCVFITLTEEDTVDLSDIISPETCLLLSKPSNECDIAPSISIKLKSPSKSIKKVCLLCEMNLTEVYGAMGEYLKTVRGESIEEVEDTSVFGYEIDDISTNEVLLKFPGVKKSEVWLFGGRVGLSLRAPQVSLVDMTSVEARLSGAELPDGAAKFHRMLTQRSFGLASGGSCPARPGLLSAPPADTISSIKDYIDESLRFMEQRIIHSFTQQIKELEMRQNESISAIIKLLNTRLGTEP